MLTQDPGKVKPLPIAQAIETLNFLHPDEDVFELCIIGPKNTTGPWQDRAYGKKPIVAGWFRDQKKAAALAVQVPAEGVYTTLNPCQEALLARADHRLKAGANRTKDTEISRIGNLLIDLDPIRPEGISSTNQEHEEALGMAAIIRDDLAQEGLLEPLVGDSGNGAHLIYALDLANIDDNVDLLKRVLAGLAIRYASKLKELGLEIDQKVFNPARLTKLYGTITRKGDNTQDRPHRMAQIISLPHARRPVPIELLQKIATPGQSQGPAQAEKAGAREGQFDIEAYLSHYGVVVSKVKEHRGGMLYCLETCLFDPGHSGNEAAIGRTAEGKLYYQCFHNSCKGRTWVEARRLISGDDKLTRFIIGGYSVDNAPTGQAKPKLTSSEVLEHHHTNTPFLGEVERSQLVDMMTTAGWSQDKVSYISNILAQSERTTENYNLAAEVREWVLSSRGVFLSSDFVREAGLSSMSSREFNKNLSKVFERLVKDGVIERVGERRGHFRRIERECEALDFLSASPEILPVKWPFELEKLVNIYRKNLAVVAGTSNAGKTAFLLDFVRLNMASFPINYFSSEMGPEELRLRLEKFDLSLTDWRFKPYERAANFADAIIPDAINVVDYLELTDNFYKVAGELKSIFDKLTTGLAVIALQKKAGASVGRGGDFSLEKARLYLSMDPGEMKIIKAKNWAQPGHNPNNLKIRFKLVNGARFIELPD
jgi:hypothetical protein